MKREILKQFQGKENVTHVISDNGTESYLSQSRSFGDEVSAKGATIVDTYETEDRHVLILFNDNEKVVGKYYMGKKLQGKTPSELLELRDNLVFFESFNSKTKQWIPCVGILNNNSLKDIASKAISFSNNEIKTNIEEIMCNLDNIILAVNLAYSAMQYKDPARNEYEVKKYKDLASRISLAKGIQSCLKRHEWPYGFGGIKYSRLKNNGIDYREGFVQNITEYSLRYLYGIIKFREIGKSIPKNIFGGCDDVFTLNNDENKYETYLEEFVQAQEKCATKYKYLYIFDFRNFFKNIDISRLKDLYFGSHYTHDEWYQMMFSKVFEKCGVGGLNPCSEVDFFFVNLYLKEFDSIMTHYEGIHYYRYCDDIRIFTNDSSLLDTLTKNITSVLLPMSLELNKEKTRLIDTSKNKVELSKACFVWSSRIYFGTNENSILLEGKTLADIINNDQTTTYIYKLLKDVTLTATDYDEDYNTYLNNLIYILRNVRKNATFYRLVLDLLFKRGTSDYVIMMFQFILEQVIAILKDEAVEPFVKYWTLRVFFCTDESYYIIYKNEENKWKDQSWYPRPCLFNQIIDILRNKYLKDESYGLLHMISDYIINIIKPINVDDIPDHNDKHLEQDANINSSYKDDTIGSQLSEHFGKTMNKSVNKSKHLLLLQHLLNNSLFTFKHPSDKSDLPSFMWNDEGLFMGYDSILPCTIPFLWIRTLAKRNVEKFDEVIDLLNKEFGINVSEKIDIAEILQGIRRYGYSDFKPYFDVHVNKSLLSTFYGDCLSVNNFILLFGLHVGMNALLPSQSDKVNIPSVSLSE